MEQNYISQLECLLSAGPFTQAQLAKRLGVTPAALSRWIHGYARPRSRRIEAVGKLYREVVGYSAITEAQLSELVRRADGLRKKGMWAAIARHQALQDELLLEHTYNSTSIEGTTLSKKETEVVIFSKGLLPDKSLTEHLEVTNHASVLREILRGEKSQARISEGLIRDLHRNLMQGIREDAGEYSKRARVIRGVSIALTHPKDIPEEMGHLIREWRRGPARKTVRDIALFHVRFELIHPFGDGNGRVGRLLMVLQCLQADYPPVVIENARKAEYFEVLEYSQRKSEGPFVRFVVDEMERTNKILKRYR